MKGLLLLAVAVSLVAAACLNRATEATPTPITPRVSTDQYIDVFNQVTLSLVNDTRILGFLAVSISQDDQLRSEIEDDTRLVLEDLEKQLERIEGLEPVPDEVAEAHESVKIAVMRYISASSLLLPDQGDESTPFQYTEFQALMMEGGKNFHGAGALLGGITAE